MSERLIEAPLGREVTRSLSLGDVVFVTGTFISTAGYPTHQRLMECIERGVAPPIDIRGQALFHLGSMSRTEQGRIKPLYVNPTTSTRFNAFVPAIVRHFGISALAGKGGLDAEGVKALQEVGCVYLSMLGGGAPLLTEGVRGVVETGWDDLIMQFRLTRFRVERFGPLIVAIDAHGNSIYHQLTSSAQARRAEIITRLNAERPG